MLTKKADNTYTLAVANCVTTISKGEFSADTSIIERGATVPLNTRLNGKLGANPDEAVTEISLPPTLTQIGAYAFYAHTKAKGTLTIGKGVQGIGDYAFRYRFL